MYTVRDFGDMIADTARMQAYEAALRRSVKPGSVVVDIGAGTGIFTLLACRFGARKVYAIDPNPAIDVARDLVRDNGFRDRVEIISKMSTEVELPERADVIVSDVRGVLPTFSGSLATIIDARSRWLRPGGVLIPKRDELRVTIVEAPSLYEGIVRPWEELHLGFDASSAKKRVVSDWCTDRLTPISSDQMLAEPQAWATLDYETVTALDVEGAVTLPITRAGTGHGLAVWFEATLTDEDRFSTRPGMPCIYARVFFPWPEPVVLEAGAMVEVSLRAVPGADDYVFSWNAQFSGKETRQTNFFSRLRMDQLLAGEDHRPRKLGTRGLATARALELLAAGSSLGEAATNLAQTFPEQFRSRQGALVLVRELAARYA